MLESRLQAVIAKYLKKNHQAAVFKTVAVGHKGFPDLTACLPGGRTLFIEVKVPGGRLSPWQKRVHRDMRAAGAEVIVIYSLAELEAYLLQK